MQALPLHLRHLRLEGVLREPASALRSSRHIPHKLHQLEVESLVDFPQLLLYHLEIVAALPYVVELVQRVSDYELWRGHVSKRASALELASSVGVDLVGVL